MIPKLHLLILCALSVLGGSAFAADSPPRPNIVLLLFDDLPYAGMSALGNTRIETPHMDRLAREGMTFTRAYSEMLCAPSRFTIFTGQWSARHGHTNVGSQQYPHVKMKEPELTQPLTPKSFNLAKLLQSAGYITAIFGKWHMATVGLKPAFAKQCGFDEAVPVLSAASYKDVVKNSPLHEAFPRPPAFIIRHCAFVIRGGAAPERPAHRLRRPGLRRFRLHREQGREDPASRPAGGGVGSVQELCRRPGLLADAVQPVHRTPASADRNLGRRAPRQHAARRGAHAALLPDRRIRHRLLWQARQHPLAGAGCLGPRLRRVRGRVGLRSSRSPDVHPQRGGGEEGLDLRHRRGQRPLVHQTPGRQPRWCAVAFILPHLPWEPDERFAAPYREAGCSETLAACYGSISQMDDATGRLLKGLQELGAAEDTIVVFVSDNGPSYKGLSDEDSRSRNPAGLKGTKATAWENGIRVPLLVRWPQRFAAGERTQFASVEDLLPTLADLTGLDATKFPPHQPWHGISRRLVLEDAAAPETERTVFRVAIADDGAVGGKRAFVSDPASLPMTEQHVTLRGPRFKFHQFAGGGTALFDLDADPGESRDVKEQFPEIARRYAAELAAEYQRIVTSGRALRMPVVHVGKPQPGVNAIDGVMAQRSTGKVNGTGKGARGFLQAGDSVVYGIDVQHTGNFELTIAGENLDRARGWELRIGDTVVPLKEATAGQLSFAPVALTPGPAAVTVGVRDSAGPTKDQPILSRLSFRPRP